MSRLKFASDILASALMESDTLASAILEAQEAGELRASGSAEQKDPGPDSYNFEREDQKRKLMGLVGFYAEEGPTFDPEGKYLCGSCYFRQLMDWGDTPACYIVDGKISMETGSCWLYYHGSPDSEWNPLPTHHKYTKKEAGYAERPKAKGFGCFPRCEYATPAEGQDKDGREFWCSNWGVHVRSKACCAFEEGEDSKDDFVDIESLADLMEAGGEGSGCNPEVAEEHGTKCGPPMGEHLAEFYLHEKTGEAQGSNPGGIYKGEDSVSRYVKFYPDERSARGELLANHIYNDVGVSAPKSILFKKDGKDVVAHELLEGKTLQQAGSISQAQRLQFLNGFAADVLTANWDAVGTGNDNVFISSKGDVYRIDQGGTFLKRAKGGDKPDSLLNQITEAKQFFNPDKNPYYAGLAKQAGVSSVADLNKAGGRTFEQQVQDLVALRSQYPGGQDSWRPYIDATVPAMPDDEKKKIASMMDARTNLMTNLVLQLATTPQSSGLNPEDQDVVNKLGTVKKYKPREWGSPSYKLVGGYFRPGTVLASVYSSLSEKPGEWQSISKIKSELEAKLGKNLYNISQNTLKQGGKKTGLWQVEISGDSIRMYVNKPGEKNTVTEIPEDKKGIADQYAKKFMEMSPYHKGKMFEYKNTVLEYFDKMGISSASSSAYLSAVSSWAGSPNSTEGQYLRQVGMGYYHREASGEYLYSPSHSVFDKPGTMKMAKAIEPAMMAMKALSGSIHQQLGTQYVYRNIGGDAAMKISKALQEAKEKGLNAVPIPFNSLSSWSTNPNMHYNAGKIKVRMKVDPENIWSTHLVTPDEFVHGEDEVVVGIHQPKEIFDVKDVSVDGPYFGQELYKEFHKNFATMIAAKDDGHTKDDEELRVYWDADIPMFDGDEENGGEVDDASSDRRNRPGS